MSFFNRKLPAGAGNDHRAPYNQKDPEKVKIKVLVSVTYSKSFEVEVEEGCTGADLRDAIKEMGVLPNDILQAEHIRLRKHIHQNEKVFDEDFKKKLIRKRDICKPWHEDEFEVMEDF